MSTYAHGYCHGSHKLESFNLDTDFWNILTTYKWSKEIAAQNYSFTPFGGLFVTMYNTNHGPIKFLIKLQEEKNTSINYISIYRYLFTKLQNIKVTHNHPYLPYYPLDFNVK